MSAARSTGSRRSRSTLVGAAAAQAQRRRRRRTAPRRARGRRRAARARGRRVGRLDRGSSAASTATSRCCGTTACGRHHRRRSESRRQWARVRATSRASASSASAASEVVGLHHGGRTVLLRVRQEHRRLPAAEVCSRDARPVGCDGRSRRTGTSAFYGLAIDDVTSVTVRTRGVTRLALPSATTHSSSQSKALGNADAIHVHADLRIPRRNDTGADDQRQRGDDDARSRRSPRIARRLTPARDTAA